MDTATARITDESVDVLDGQESLAEASGRQPNGGVNHLSGDNAGGSIRQAKKKVNPLVDLIDTEKAYVDLLAAIIRKVAAAWSRTNFPPPELDAMFRSVEVVYRANRSLLSVSTLSCISQVVLSRMLYKLIETERNRPQSQLSQSFG